MQKERALRQLKKIAATALSLFMVLMNVSGAGTFLSYADEGGEEQVLPDGAVGSGITISSDSNASGSNAQKKLTAVSPLASSSDADYTLVFDTENGIMQKSMNNATTNISAAELTALGITITGTNGSAPYILELTDMQFKTTADTALDIEGTRDVTIDISGDCSITSGGGTAVSRAIFISQAAVTFTGGGKLTALGGTVAPAGSTYGIYASNIITVNGGSVTACGGDFTGTGSSTSCGIFANIITVNDGSMLASGVSDAAVINGYFVGYARGSNTYQDENKDNYNRVQLNMSGTEFLIDGTAPALTVLMTPQEYSLYFAADEGIMYKNLLGGYQMTSEDLKKLGITVGKDSLKFDKTQFSTAEQYALYVYSDAEANVTLDVTGACSLTSRNEYSDWGSAAIYCNASLTITGDGTLTLNGGNMNTGSDTSSYVVSYGLFCEENITVDMEGSGELIVNGGNVIPNGYTIGIGVNKAAVKGGSVRTCGGTAKNNEGLGGDQYGSVGLWCTNMFVGEGSIYASGQSLAVITSIDFFGTMKGSLTYLDSGELADAHFSNATFYTQDVSNPVKTLSVKTEKADGAYYVWFDPGVGDCKTEKMITDTDGILDDPLPAAAINGSTDYFLGWFTAAGEQVNDGHVFTENTTIYARYKGSDPYSITFDPNGGTIDKGGLNGQYVASTGLDGKLSEKDRNIYVWRKDYDFVNNGYVYYGFLGWFTEQDGGVQVDPNSVFTKNTTLYAHWAKNEFTVTFNPVNSEASCTPLVMCTTNQKLTSLPDPACSGYTFGGWYTDESCSGEAVTTGRIYEKDTKLYAKWEFTGYPVYTITFNANGGLCKTKTAQTNENRMLSTLPVVVHSGFFFTGWYANGFRVNTSKQYDGDTTLTAHWAKILTADTSENSEESGNGSGGTSYRGTSGEWQHDSTGYWYRYTDGTWPANVWKEIDGKWYHFDENGYMQTGWILDKGKWYYLYESGVMVRGLLLAPDGYFYCFWSDGSMAVGDVTVYGRQWHFNDQVPPEPTYMRDPAKGTWIPNGSPYLPYGAEKD
jgi:uncharacterized repeat protein (TIGR02543 family)